MWTFMLKSVILLACGFTTKALLLSENPPTFWSLQQAVTGVQSLLFDCSGTLKIISQSPSHCSNCFGIIQKGTGTFTLFYAARNGASLNYDIAKSYTFSLRCDDGTEFPPNGTVILGVIPNFPPSFQDTASIIAVSSATTAGGTVYEPKPIDGENDQLTFTLEESPNNGFFQINANGVVTAKKSLNTFCEQETVTISMQDGSNAPVTKTITMDPGGNTKPTLTDWNRIVTVPENTILELPITDNLGPQVEGSCVITVNPPEYSSYFDTSRCPSGASSRIITPAGGKTFNFEVDPPVNISLVFDNGNCPSDPRWLYIQYADVPEPPTLTLDKMDFITKEGFIEIEPEYEIKDDDVPDKHVYSFVDPDIVNSNFKIDPDTGRIYTPKYYQMDCDADRLGFIFDVQVTDQNGNVSSEPVKVKLNLTDVNDHRPEFTRRFDPSPSLYADCIQPFTLLDLSDDVTDDDCERTTNKAVEFVEASSGSLSISKDGVVRLTKPPIAGQVDILQIQAIDKGEPPLLSETETISIRGFPCPTTVAPVVVTEDNADNNNNNNNNNNDNNNNNNDGNTDGITNTVTTEAGFFDNPWNIALVALAGLLGLLLLPLLLYLCYRFCGPWCSNACHKCRNPPLKANRIKPNKLSGDGKGKAENKGPEEGVAEAEGEVVAGKKAALVGGKIIRYGGYVDEYGYSHAESSGGGGYGYSSGYGEGGYGEGGYGESGYGGGEGIVVGEADGGKTNDSYWKEHFQDKGFKDQPSRLSLPATVEKT